MKKKSLILLFGFISIIFLQTSPSNLSLITPSHTSKDVDLCSLFVLEESMDNISLIYSTLTEGGLI